MADSCCAGSLSYIALASSSTGVFWSGREGGWEVVHEEREREKVKSYSNRWKLLHPSTQTGDQPTLRQLREKRREGERGVKVILNTSD